jgi:hypothetical protein
MVFCLRSESSANFDCSKTLPKLWVNVEKGQVAAGKCLLVCKQSILDGQLSFSFVAEPMKIRIAASLAATKWRQEPKNYNLRYLNC